MFEKIESRSPQMFRLEICTGKSCRQHQDRIQCQQSYGKLCSIHIPHFFLNASSRNYLDGDTRHHYPCYEWSKASVKAYRAINLEHRSAFVECPNAWLVFQIIRHVSYCDSVQHSVISKYLEGIVEHRGVFVEIYDYRSLDVFLILR